MRSAAPLLLSCILLLPASIVRADSDDQDRAREAYEHHQILSLATILKAVEKRYGRNVVNIEYEEHGDRPVYEFEIINASGQVIEVVVDAKTGRSEGPEGEKD